MPEYGQKKPTAFPVAEIILFLSISFLSFFKIYESDAFWHLKSGEVMVKELRFLDTDPFTFTGAGKEWINTYWLFDVLIYIVYSITGITGIILCKSFIASLAFLMMLSAMRIAGRSEVLSFVVLLPAATLFRERFLIRPDILSFLFISIYFYIFFLFKFSKRNKLYILPLIMLFWTNAHTGSFFGILLALSFLAGESLSSFSSTLKTGEDLKKKLGELKTLAKYCLSVIPAYFISPYGYKNFTYLYSQIYVPEIIDIAEFRPTFLGENIQLFIIVMLFFLFLLVSLRQIPASLIIPAFLFFFPGATSKRMAFYDILVSLPPVIYGLERFMIGINKIETLQSLKYAALILFSLITVYLKITNDPFHYWGSGIKDFYYPAGEVEFLKKTGVNARIYNTLNLGGGIIFAGYPEIRVFADTRIQVNEEVIRELVQAEKDPVRFHNLIQKYEINAAIVDTKFGYIRNGLLKKEDWALLYWSDYSMLLLRRVPEFEKIIKQNEIGLINPETLIEELPLYINNLVLTERILFQLQRSVAINPGCYKANYALAFLLKRQENRDMKKILSYLNRAYQIEPHYLPTLYELANYYASLNDFNTSLSFYKKLLKEGRFYQLLAEYPSVYHEIGRVYLNLGKKGKAKRYFLKSRELSPADAASAIYLEMLKD